MNVSVGSFSDPDGLEGLAHFLGSLFFFRFSLFFFLFVVFLKVFYFIFLVCGIGRAYAVLCK